MLDRIRHPIQRPLVSRRNLHVAGWIVTFVAMLALAGCGPVASSSAVTDAAEAIKQAEQVNAHRFAAFSYWSAVNYLEKAKQVEGYSEFGPATDFAVLSMEIALRSIEETKEFHHQEKLRRERLKKSGKRPGTAPNAAAPAPKAVAPAPPQSLETPEKPKKKRKKRKKKPRKKGADKP